eukprot:SAG22_NODE_639_length_8255_cov_13.659882_4_plen_100_part_00
MQGGGGGGGAQAEAVRWQMGPHPSERLPLSPGGRALVYGPPGCGSPGSSSPSLLPRRGEGGGGGGAGGGGGGGRGGGGGGGGPIQSRPRQGKARQLLQI